LGEKILITGATGFIGQALLPALVALGRPIVVAHRGSRPDVGLPVEYAPLPDIGPETDWTSALRGCGTVIHLAARTPGRGVTKSEIDRVNVGGTERLVADCLHSDIRALVNISSILALSDNAHTGPITDSTPSIATSDYGLSKWQAEQAVQGFAGHGRTALSLRLPAVFGAGAKGNWALLQKLAASGLPLPFGLIRNRRSLLPVGDVVSAILSAIAPPPGASAGGAYNVAGPESASLREIVIWLRQGMGMSPRLLPLPRSVMSLAAGAGLGRAAAQSLFGDLLVDGSRFRRDFGWEPVDLRQAIVQSGADFAKDQKR